MLLLFCVCVLQYDGWDITIYLVSIMWGVLVLLCIWPPLTALLPR